MTAAPQARGSFVRDEVQAWLWDYAERELGIQRSALGLELDLASAGVDSLEGVTLVGALERSFGRPIPPTLLWDCRTIGEFLDRLAHLEAAGEAPGDEAPHASRHEFGRYSNPYLSRKVEQLKMDKRFVRGEGCYLFDDGCTITFIRFGSCL